MHQPKISEEQFNEWKEENPVTIRFLKLLKDEAGARRILLGSGEAIDRKNTFHDIGEYVYKVLIQAETYELLANIEYEDLED